MSTNVTFEELWEEAWGSYLNASGRSVDEVQVMSKLQSIDDLESHLDEEQLKFESFRKKHGKLYSALSKAIRPILVVSSIAKDSIQNTPVGPACAILGATMYLVGSASGVSQVYDQIEQLFEKLYSFTIRLQEYVTVEMGYSLRQNVVAILRCVLEIIARSEKVIKEGRFRKYLGVAFVGKDEGIIEIFSRLRSLCDEEERLVLAISYATSQRVDSKTETIDQSTQALVEKVAQMKVLLKDLTQAARESRSEAKLDAEKALLDIHLRTEAHKKSTVLYTQYIENTLESTGSWLLQDPSYELWIAQKTPIFCLTGGPGTGKSFLSSIVISNIKSSSKSVEESPVKSVAYFYIKEDYQELHNMTNLLKSLAYQIALQDPLFWQLAVRCLGHVESMATPRQIWQNLFIKYFILSDCPASTRIILDGLDEASDKTLETLFRLLEDIPEIYCSSYRLTVALFCRPEVSAHFGQKLRRTLTILEIGDKNSSDISMYTNRHIPSILVVREAKRTKSKAAAIRLAQDIRRRILERADGIFFKVVLIMQQVSKKVSVSEVLKAIEEIPRMLETMIYQAFERLTLSEDVQTDDLNELLRWVCFAKRPLFLSELYPILTIHKGQPYDALESSLRGKFSTLFKLHGDESLTFTEDEVDDSDELNIDDLLIDDVEEAEGNDEDQCLVASETRESQIYAEDFNEETRKRFQNTDIRFSHASIRDCLLKQHSNKDERPNLPSGLSMDPVYSELHMATICAKRISQGAEIQDFDFINYAAGYVLEHLTAVEYQDDVDTRRLVIRLICDLFFKQAHLENVIRGLHLSRRKVLNIFFVKPRLSSLLVQRWLRNASKEDCSPEEWDWICESVQSEEAFYRPLALEASRIWLIKSEKSDEDCVTPHFHLFLIWIVHGLLETRSKAADDNFSSGLLATGYPPRGTIERFEQIIHFGNWDRSSHWHTMFGWLLLLAGFSSRAIEQFAQATTLDPTSWYAWYGVVEEHCMSKNYEAVSDPIEKALLYTPTQFTVERLGLQRAAIEAKIRIGEPKIVLPLIQELSIDYPSDPRVVDLHIHCLYGLRNYQGILKLMETHFDKGIRRLTSLRMAQSEISRAYAFIGATDALVSFITPCLEKSSWLYECIPASPWIFAHFAEFVDHFEQFTEKAMELFERILSPEFKTSILQEYKWAHDYPLSTAINHLGSVYSIKVFKLRHNGEDPSIWLLKLQTLVDTYGDPSKMAGGDRVKLWFHLYKAGQDSPDERSVRFMRQYLADHIIRVIEFESKNGGGSWIPSHLAGVGVILLRLGDIENGMIAWAAQFLPDATNTGGLLVEDGSDCMEEPISFPSRFRCDGMCTAQFHEYNTRYKSFYTCLDCWNVEYCGDCLKDLKDGKLSFLKCDPNHHFVQLLPVSREYVGRAVTATEGGWKLNRDWADAIKEKWCDKDADSTMG